MDYPFGLLRADDHNYPRQLDISVGYDYVLGLDNTTYVADGGLENINRLNFRAEWETGILTPRDRISFLFDSYYDLDATHVMKDSNEEWKTFYMIKIDHAISYNDDTKTLTKISIKYTEGELPPNFVKGYVIGGGLSIEF